MAANYTKIPRTIFWLVHGGPALQPYYIGKAPITNEQYEAFDPTFVRSPISPLDRGPVCGVSLRDARRYCRWYAELSRKPIRLPTAVEWEHACRGGTLGRTFWGDRADGAEAHAEHRHNTPNGLGEWDGKRPNPLGLHGMLGGVWEWTDTGELRGGSLRSAPEELACALRRADDPARRGDDYGFRIVRSFEPARRS